jgi:hypothetical protein
VLRERFPLIFSICDNDRVSVAQACSGQHPLRLRRTLDASGRAEWDQVLEVIEHTQLVTGADKISWTLDPSGVYSVSSMYLALSRGASVLHFRDMWAAKLPLKMHLYLATGTQPSSYPRGASPPSGAIGWAVCDLR